MSGLTRGSNELLFERLMAIVSTPFDVEQPEAASTPDPRPADPRPRRSLVRPPGDTPWLTVLQAAAYAQVGTAVIYGEVKAGRLKSVRIAGRRDLRIKREYIDAWLERGRG